MNAETIAKNVDAALKRALKVYDETVGIYCPEEDDDMYACDKIQDRTNDLIPKIEVLLEVMGYDEESINVLLALIYDYYHTREYDSGRIDNLRLAEYERLRNWLEQEGETLFCDLLIRGVTCKG